jgi:signal transduction histidine kinase
VPKIFNPFFSTRSDGTGLGLSITKNIVEQQGGKIEVESQVNVGTKFIITLPAITQSA